MASRTEANGSTKLVHFLDLNEFGLEEISEEQKGAAKREAADFLKNQTLRQISAGESPVAGQGRFRILNAEYAKKEKGGRRISDLELEGDLKDSLISEPSSGSFIKYGHEGEQVPKADGNNQISSKAKAWARQNGHPKRQYIPEDGQKFDNSITDGIKRILNNFKRSSPAQRESTLSDDEFFEGTGTTAQIRDTTTSSTASSSGLFSDDVVEGLVEDAFRRRGIF